MPWFKFNFNHDPLLVRFSTRRKVWEFTLIREADFLSRDSLSNLYRISVWKEDLVDPQGILTLHFFGWLHILGCVVVALLTTTFTFVGYNPSASVMKQVRGKKRTIKRSNRSSNLITPSNSKVLFRIVNLLVWFLSLPSSPSHELVRRIRSLMLKNGSTFAVSYLKEATRVLQAYVSGKHIRHSDELLGIRGGLPTILPTELRVLVKDRNSNAIRGVLTLLQVYRIMQSKPLLKLGTIVRPFSGLSSTLPSEYIEGVSSLMRRKFDFQIVWSKDELIPFTTAGPNSRISLNGMGLDILALKEHGLLDHIKYFYELFDAPNLLNLFEESISYMEDSSWSRDFPKAGKLSTKLEAAGKVRVFAIVDAWTQMALWPIHKTLFRFLKQIPQDGTFNQGKPLRDLLSRIGPNCKTYSFDLSAATDRLPIDLQVQVIESLFENDELALRWKSLLVDRDYHLSEALLKGQQIEVDPDLYKDGKFRYAVGQPMGALSSWAALAITHHFIVQYCWKQLGNVTWFSDYALLGDDIVIAHEALAWKYHSIMTDVLGVEINLSKSLISDNSVVEFAKRLVSPEEEYTPLGGKLLLHLVRSSDLAPLFVDSINKGMAWSSMQLSQLFLRKKGYWEKNKWRLVGPFGITPLELSPTPRWEVTGSLKYSDLLEILTDVYFTFEEALLPRIEAHIAKIESCIARPLATELPWIAAYQSLLERDIRQLPYFVDRLRLELTKTRGVAYGGYMDPFESGDLQLLSVFGITITEEEFEALTCFEQVLLLQSYINKIGSTVGSALVTQPIVADKPSRAKPGLRVIDFDNLFHEIFRDRPHIPLQIKERDQAGVPNRSL